ncbi:MAG: DNA topoisomerase IV subunit A [Rhodospirillales bacterium]|nr:DNA topoisomerase IV subunit A [Rhodospirillales bacterium]MCW8862457.1 DNA topoisomerase IV subunit A [Rhodospirillales bacterium]MCW8952518.1 DNA topoisomerase IV subunit A [Rhodospirillales bacterium]MCW8970030.1 DNA topoisomerase IV subunit A [Rhodospirillales bacterium]MCW9003004.1 DNA topoisomerase IV subunit A [Rhodospirillales bacterium]
MNEITPAGEIRDARLADALSERYLAYALSTIMSRSLPDVRDGLKPVHRRLLFAMRQLKLDPGSGYKKCARVVGDVIGKYHPHGDVAVYDALVRLAQDFAVRYPLVDGQGNFGNVDGDNAAAMRYTESRLTTVAESLLEGIEENAVDFRFTYDGEEEEPVVLPASFPNLLANGSTGIAVGMATNIPPHNVDEICGALTHLIKFPNATIAKLVEFVTGPDFPTGGVLVEPSENILEAYKTGRGSFRVRARWTVEQMGRGLYQVVVTEIPYQVQKAKLVERIADLLNARKLPLLADIRDESTTDVRLVIEPKSRTVEPEVLMEQLFRQTDLESRFTLNMNVLDAERTPRVMNLREVLQAFLDHRQTVLVRRSEFRLDKIERRLEVLGGYLIAYLNLDEVIRIIREEDDAKASLIRAFKLTDMQAEAILNMRLRSLRKLEEVEIRKEHDSLNAEKADLKTLLGDEGQRWSVIATQIAEIKAAFGKKTEIGKRRTEIGEAPDVVDVPVEAMIEREPITIVCSEKGWIRAIKGHQTDPSTIKYKEGDRGRFVIQAQTTDKLLIFSTNGRFYTVSCDKLPGGRGNGEPLRLMIDMTNGHEPLTMFIQKPGRRFLVASESGRGFVLKEDDIIAQTKNGKVALNLPDGEEASACVEVADDADHIAVIGDNRKLLVFALDEVPEMSRGRGVILQKYKDGGLADVKTFRLADGLSWKTGDRTRTETDLLPWLGKRAGAGRLPPRGFSSANRFT